MFGNFISLFINGRLHYNARSSQNSPKPNVHNLNFHSFYEQIQVKDKRGHVNLHPLLKVQKIS